MVVLSSPAWAHGENDARPIARDVQTGPYVATLWQVIGDHGSSLSSHLVVSFGEHSPTAGDVVVIEVGGAAGGTLEASPTSATQWSTAATAEFGADVRIGVSTESGAWWSQSTTVPRPPSALLPMRALMAVFAFVSTLVIAWLGKRARRAWAKTPSPAALRMRVGETT